MTICPNCGKPGFKGLCPECKPDPLLEKLHDLMLQFCHKSRTAKIGHQWKEALDLEDAVLQLINHKGEFQKGTKIQIALALDIPIGPGVHRKTTVEITAKKGTEIQVYEVPIEIYITVSPTYATEGTRYFEGVLQLRNYQEKHHKHIKELIYNDFAKQRKQGGFITKEIKHKDGFDFISTNQSLLPALAKKIANDYGGEVTMSAHLHTLDKMTSKPVFRSATLVKLHDFIYGEVVKVDDQLYKITSSKNRKFYCQSLRNAKKTMFDLTHHKYSIVGRKEDLQKARITQLRPQPCVLHPHTFQSTSIENPDYEKGLNVNEIVSVLEYEGQIWIV